MKRHGPLSIALAALLIAVCFFLLGYIPRHERDTSVAAAAAQRSRQLPSVSSVVVHRAPATTQLLYPGNLIPLTEAYIFARATGYVRKRYVDIGDRVRSGQLMADIEAPDLDQQVDQARATLAQSQRSLEQAQHALQQTRAQRDLARLTYERDNPLVAHGVIARQQGDQDLSSYLALEASVRALEANVLVAEEAVKGNQANLQRMFALQGFEKVQAPFAGVVTARNIDIGAFINGAGAAPSGSVTPSGGTQIAAAAGNAGTSTNLSTASQGNGVPTGAAASGSTSTEMFRVAQISTLRVLVNVPEEVARSIQVGQPAVIFLPAFPGEQFHGKVTRTANALDLNSRTLLTEVQTPNPKGLLLPGMYVEVKIASQFQTPPVLVPGESVITRSNGTQIAVLEPVAGQPGSVRKVHLQNVAIGRDYGMVTEVTEGLQDGSEIVSTPGDETQEGVLVKATPAPAIQQSGGTNRPNLQPSSGSTPPRRPPNQNTQPR